MNHIVWSIAYQVHIAHFKSQYCGFVSYNLASMFRVTGGLSTQRKDKRCQIKCRLKTSACISVLMKTQHGLSTVACSSSIPAQSTADAREITTNWVYYYCNSRSQTLRQFQPLYFIVIDFEYRSQHICLNHSLIAQRTSNQLNEACLPEAVY
jgi:hypothetical protein